MSVEWVLRSKEELNKELILERQEIKNIICNVLESEFSTILNEILDVSIKKSMAGDSTPFTLVIALNEWDVTGYHDVCITMTKLINDYYSKSLFDININQFLRRNNFKKNAPKNLEKYLQNINFGVIASRNKLIQEVIMESKIIHSFIETVKAKGFSIEVAHHDAHSILKIF
ncbi:hypothetical protein [Paenibacillus sp. IITD108]|uniref:hypothetical protein n=1 Tax=Paenibacillus sp. IITD108 TaxID=3116649 RepID=UPI002F40D51F